MSLPFSGRGKRKVLLIGLFSAIILGGAGCTFTQQQVEYVVSKPVFVPKVKTAIVAAGLSREITATGEVRAAKSAMFTAEVRAEVASVLVKIGDTVRAQQTLVQLSSASVTSTWSTADTALTNARNSLRQTQLASEQSIEVSRSALATTQVQLANTLTQNAALRKQAEETLAAAEVSSEFSIAAAETALANKIRAAYPVAKNAVSESDEIIGVSSIYESANDEYEHFLGVFDSATKEPAKTAIRIALNLLERSADERDSARALLAAAEDATIKTLAVLDHSSTGVNFTQMTLNANISTINTELAAVRTAVAALASAVAALASAQQSTDGNSQTIVSATANFEATLAQLAANETAARQSIESAQIALESAEKSAELTRTSAQTSFDAAAGNFDQTQISRSKLTIRAPFAGRVTAIAVEPGDEVRAGETLVRVEDATQLKIISYLSASEIRKIKVGDEVRIATKSADTIAAIASSADPITKKYEVEIRHQNRYLQPGEFVKLRFQIERGGSSADARIFLPISAINILGHGSFVWQIENGTATQAAVELGAIEGEFVEIVGGLELGTEVVVEGGRILDVNQNVVDVEIVNAN